ncbi:sensor histidine kinase [Clostridium paraputrificum]|uniref:sensor histidine kinase n=1 Tax=Clostridium paraputrificum TaxID=29363 RepID=UPI00374FB872
MTLIIADVINSVFQAMVFVIVPNSCVENNHKNKKNKLILAVVLVSLGLQIVMECIGNSSVSIIMTHLAPFFIVWMFYREDGVSVAISYNILYLICGLMALFSSFFCEIIKFQFPIEYIEISALLCVYSINCIFILLILINKNIFYKIYRTIKTRNISIVFLILLTFFLDLLLIFTKVINSSKEVIYTSCVLIIIVLVFIGATLYFAAIERRAREIEKLNNALEGRIEELRKVKHDYGAQISYLYGLHLMKRYERAGELLKDIINGHNSINDAIEISNNSDSVISIITKGIKHNGINIILDEQADLNNIDITEFELQRVLSNIISNAVTAMDGQGTLAIRTYENFNDIIICVRNNGPMIGNIIIDKIFESGFSTKKNINKEHGFGLAIVKETVEKCNGKISVTSDIKKTEFIIILPRKKV